jgi:hypothetical protein
VFLHKVALHDLRSIESLVWEVDHDKARGWHVIIGDNGSGKSGLLRAIALALVGPQEAIALRQDWNDWLRREQSMGYIHLWLDWDRSFDRFSGKGRPLENYYLRAGLRFRRSDADSERVTLHAAKYKRDPKRHVWGPSPGWFSASYGPFRRFAGGDKDQEKLFYSNPKLARHLSVFGESVALTECLEWLKLLHYKTLENDPEGDLLEPVKAFVNQKGFLPHEARLDSVTSRGVRFIDGNGCEVLVESLSDGYRSILSMTFELIRQLATTYGPTRIFDKKDPTKIIAPGVVLIDEIDAHLHPTWQRRVGLWFREHFPKIQFIVTTHSPLICQAATVGSVFRLPQPGSGEQARMVTGIELDRLLYGNVLDAYGTGAFGDVAVRSPEAFALLERLATLNQKDLAEGLSATEKREQKKLRNMLPTAASEVPENEVSEDDE